MNARTLIPLALTLSVAGIFGLSPVDGNPDRFPAITVYAWYLPLTVDASVTSLNGLETRHNTGDAVARRYRIEITVPVHRNFTILGQGFWGSSTTVFPATPDWEASRTYGRDLWAGGGVRIWL